MGKTKDLIMNNDGTCTFKFKDDVCSEDGVFNPGANEAGLKIDGMGKASMLLSKHFFPIIKEAGIPVHYISIDVDAGTMLGKHLDILPVEFIWRAKAWGSFCKAYKVEQGKALNGLIEATLKDDELGDPRINREAVIAIGKATAEQYDACDRYTRKIGTILNAELLKFGYELIDFKVEFGLDSNGEVILADEISGGIWRIFENGKSVDPIDCAKKICPDYY
jgi:phosphoribosylaminoimidazole-succinocarboxamide synthase